MQAAAQFGAEQHTFGLRRYIVAIPLVTNNINTRGHCLLLNDGIYQALNSYFAHDSISWAVVRHGTRTVT